MTKITLQDGKVLLRNGKIATEQSCCCGPPPCDPCSLASRGYYDDPGPHIFYGSFNSGVPGVPPQAGVWVGGVTENIQSYLFDPSTGSWDTASIASASGLMRSDTGSLYDCVGPWTPAESGPTYLLDAMIADYPPPDDGAWYVFVVIDFNIAWYPACAPKPCAPEFQSREYAGLTLDSFQFNGVDCPENICCNGNDPYPSISPTESCGHGNWVFGAPPGAPQAICLGACCYNDGTADVCGGLMSKAECDALSGTWHSGKSCAPDPCNLFP